MGGRPKRKRPGEDKSPGQEPKFTHNEGYGMKQEWKPGDVARVNGAMAVRADDGRSWFTTSGRLSDPNVAYIYPLVVIDPEDREQVERLAVAYATVESARSGDEYRSWDNRSIEARGRIVDSLTAALREFAAPTPRIEEPTGLGAVVEDAEGFTWVRTHATGYPWHANLQPDDRNSTAVRKYERINVVRVLSEGVPAEADR